VALVTGAPKLLSGSVKKAIGGNKQHRHKMAAVEEGQGGLQHVGFAHHSSLSVEG